MAPGVQVLLGCTLTFGVPLVLAVRELIVFRRRGGGDGWRDPAAQPRPIPPTPGQAPGRRDLPDCLVSAGSAGPIGPQPRVERVPELA
jgi:hypothetical protein